MFHHIHDFVLMTTGATISNGSNLTAQGCRFENNRASGVYVRSSRIILDSCTLSHNRRCGLECFTSCEAHLCGCRAAANECSAVLCADSSLTFCSSQTSEHGMAGIDVRGSGAQAQVYNSSIHNGKRSAMYAREKLLRA